MSVLDKNVSYFPSKNNTRDGVSVNLLNLLQSDRHRRIIETIRSQPDSEIQKQLKDNLPCFTVAGIFSHRAEGGLIVPSGLAAVDLDSAEDYDISSVLQELRKLRFIAYAGLSCRGKRLFAVIPFLFPEKYSKQYERLIQSFEDIGFPMGDTCHKAISQPRFVSFNTEATCFYNHNADPYHLLPVDKVHYSVKASESSNVSAPDDPFSWCDKQVRKSHSFSNGYRHRFIIYLARYCNQKGIPESEALKGCLSSYCTADFTETEITKIVSHVYRKHADSYNKLPFRPLELSARNKPSLSRKSLDSPIELSPPIPENSATHETASIDAPACIQTAIPPQPLSDSVWVITSSSGKVYKPLPGGNTEVYSTMSGYLAGHLPVSLISFSEWFAVKAAEDWLMNNFITK